MLRPYEKYKDTKAVWIDSIPFQWESRKVRELFVERKIKVSDKDYAPLSVSKAGVVPQLDTAVKTDNGDNRKLVKAGDFVINSRSDRKGSSGVSTLNGSVSLINIVLKPISNENLRYLHYLLRCVPFTEEYYRNGRGLVADLWTTRYSELKNIFLPIPPRPEQDQIVRFLDWKTAEIARYIKGKRKEIAYLTELKNSLIFHAVTKGCRPTATKMGQQKWIGHIPAHWEEKMLFQCATEQNISNKNVHNQNLLSLSYGKIVNKDINTTTGLLPASFDTYQIIHNGNIILRLTDLQNDHKSLRVGLSTQTGIITSAYTCLKPRANVLPEYLYLLLHSYDVSKLFYGMGGGVRQSIGYNDIRRMIVLLPPKEEQEEIVTYCHGVQAKIDLLIDSIKNEISYLGELRTKTIADVVTGKVDVRGVIIPEYEMTTYDEIDEDINEDTTDKSEEETLDEEVDD
ncbi:restriction endonuclease subunit S [Bacillota bacterium Lsc_1132]